MADETKCLKCGGLLFKTAQIENSPYRAIVPGTKPESNHDPKSGLYYFKCPHCGAKNAVKDLPSPEGAPTRMVIDKIIE